MHNLWYMYICVYVRLMDHLYPSLFMYFPFCKKVNFSLFLRSQQGLSAIGIGAEVVVIKTFWKSGTPLNI